MLRWLLADEQAAAYWDTLRVAPPANLAVLASPAFRSTAGVPKDPANPAAGYEVLPMAEADYPAKAAWLARTFTADPATGRAPGFLWVSEHQYDLFTAVEGMLREYLTPGSRLTEREALHGVAASLHALIDRTRAARGEPPVRRP
jgi:hypothetical protein